jgi:hypothetical protein
MQPAEKIHPLAGSVFARPEAPRKQGPLAYNLDAADTAAAPLPAFGQSDQAVLPEIQELAARELSERDTPQGTPQLTTLLPGESTTSPRPSSQTLHTSISVSGDTFEPFPPAGQEQILGREKNISALESGGEDARENAYTALIPVKPVVAPMKTTVAAISGAREFGTNSGRSAGQSARNLQSAHRTEREPDQIEIHIGRIEVSAVTQTQAAPAARVSRKAESLSEYLARRDKRRP